MRSVSVSEIKSYLRCREEHRLGYALRVRPRHKAQPLRFGSAIDAGVGAWWSTGSLGAALVAYRKEADLDPYDLVMGEVLLAGYDARWQDAQREVSVYAVQEKFSLLRSGGEPHYLLSGIMDNVHRVKGGQLRVGELKTTNSEITPGSDYWTALTLDAQISVYTMAARAAGWDPDVCAYDVIRKPGIEPRRATPVASRKYTKAGVLYANQREEDETLEEWRERLVELVSGRPEEYYQRAEVVRLDAEHARALRDVDAVAWDLMRTEPDEPEVRSQESCRRFGRLCDYAGYCSGLESLDSEKFVSLGRVKE